MSEMFENRDPLTFFGIKDGTFRIKKGEEYVEFTRMTGRLTKIDSRVANFNGEDVDQWNFYFVHENEAACISLSKHSGLSQGLVNTFASLDKTQLEFEVTLTSYTKNEYSRIGVWLGEKLVSWKYALEDMPEIEVLTTKGGKEVRDATLRVKFMEKEVDAINDILGVVPETKDSGDKTGDAPPQPPPPDASDDPGAVDELKDLDGMA